MWLFPELFHSFVCFQPVPYRTGEPFLPSDLQKTGRRKLKFAENLQNQKWGILGLKAFVLPDEGLGKCAEKMESLEMESYLDWPSQGPGFLINEKQCKAIKALLIKKNEGAEEVQISE